jgi:pyruvate formate lyase activating enzyme
MFYDRLSEKRVRCRLCPWRCTVEPNERGRCGARENQSGTYYTMVYGKACATRLDPVEKVPLHHVKPGIKTLAIATAGCNLDCKFCQSWQMAQSRPEDVQCATLTPKQVVEMAKSQGCAAIAYTYTEPVNFIEYTLDVAAEARKAGLFNLCHTAGYVNEEPLRHLCSKMDAFNVDLKGFTEEFYKDVCAVRLEPVLQTLKFIANNTDRMLEVTYLVLPTLNDDENMVRQMCQWMVKELGNEVPLHFSRFFPQYKLKNLPATPIKTLEAVRKVAYESGLLYLYVGNVPGHAGESTYCPRCGTRLVWRVGYKVQQVALNRGRCPKCRTQVPGVW